MTSVERPDLPWRSWVDRENRWRREEGVPPLTPESPALLKRRLQDYGDQYRARECVARFDWVAEGYINGYLPKTEWYAEMDEFIQEAQALIANGEAIDNLRLIRKLMSSTEPLTEAETARRDEWRRNETERQERMELRKQRVALREGHRTLTLLRHHLRSPGRSPLRASRPAKTSPTS